MHRQAGQDAKAVAAVQLTSGSRPGLHGRCRTHAAAERGHGSARSRSTRRDSSARSGRAPERASRRLRNRVALAAADHFVGRPVDQGRRPAQRRVVLRGGKPCGAASCRRADVARRHVHRRRQGAVRTVGRARRDSGPVRHLARRQRLRRAAAGIVAAADEPSNARAAPARIAGITSGCCSDSRCGSTCWGSPPSIGSAS